MTRKGLKMNISKTLRNYSFDKSIEVTTEVRGKHKFTKGYRFIDTEFDFHIYWHDWEISYDEKRKNMEIIYDILDNHGFSKHIKLDDRLIRLNENGFKKEGQND